MARAQQTNEKQPGMPPSGLQADENMQSSASLSQSSDDEAEDGRFSVAEEQNFDQQSEQARRVGAAPADKVSGGLNEDQPSDAMAKSMDAENSSAKEKATLKKAVDQAVPPSESSGKA